MEIPLIDASSVFARMRAPGLIAIALAAFLAFLSLARRTARLILNRVKGISGAISNQAAAAVFSGEWSDTDSDIGSASDSDDDDGVADASLSDVDDMDTDRDDDCLIGGKGGGQLGNFDLLWGGAVVKTWEGLGLFASCSDQSTPVDSDDDGGNGVSEASVVRYWDDISIRPKWRRRRSFVMMDLW